MNEAGVNAADGLAMALVVILLVAFGTVLSVVLIVVRHSKLADSDVDRLLDELRQLEEQEEEKTIPPAAPQSPPGPPWEREADWWKKG